MLKSRRHKHFGKNSRSKPSLIQNIFAIVLTLPLVTNAFASDPIKKITTISYKDIASNITHTLGGTVPAAQRSNISAQMSDIIRQIHVDVGHEVIKGDLLISLDCRENQLKRQQAQANLNAEKTQLAHAKKQFNQAKKLNVQGNISKELHNQREAEKNRLTATLKGKQAAYALAKLNVERCQIKSPFDGYITHRHASIGELTQPGSHLLQLLSKSNTLVEANINHGLFNSFSQGKNHQFIFNNISHPLKPDFILPMLDNNTRNHIARLRFINEPAITGSVGKLTWQEADLSIPARFLVLRNKKLGIFIAENNRAKFISIKNAREGQPAMITLDDKTQIVNNGRFNINHGDVVEIINR